MKFRPFNSLAEGLLYALLLISLVYNIYATTANANAANEARMIAAQNQKFAEESQRQTVEAREANIGRQDEMKDYIKCLALLRFAEPPISQDSNREDTEAALDGCAEAE